ncbi:MAG: hypothetical protein WCL49_00515 [bacterium]
MTATRLSAAMLAVLGLVLRAAGADADFTQPAADRDAWRGVRAQLVTDSGAAPLPSTVVEAIAGFAPADRAVSAQWAAALSVAGGDGAGKAVHLLFAFATPLPAGTLVTDWAAAFSAGPAPASPDDAAWKAIETPPRQAEPRLLPLPADARLSGLRLTARTPEQGTLVLPLLKVLAGRHFNATPFAFVNAESEYTLENPGGPPVVFRATSLTQGQGEWRNTGEDRAKRIPRAPVSDVLPSWVVLSWNEPHLFEGLIMRGNLSNVKVYAFTGPAGINPSLAPDAQWRRLSFRQVFERGNGGMGERWLAVAPVETRGVKVLIERTDGSPVARLNALSAIARLRTDTIPAPVVRPPSGIAIPYELKEAGEVTMVITDAGGRPIRNLMARRQRDAGANREFWDLKDTGGKLMPPGRYGFKAITHPPLTLRYQMTPYPNIGNHAPENTPWPTSLSGRGGWLADHSSDGALATAGDRAWLGSGTAEGGHAMLEADLDGRKRWGRHNFIAWTGPQLLAANEKSVFAYAWSAQASQWPGGADFIWRVEAESHETRTLATLPPTSDRARGVRGMAALDDQLLLAVRGDLRWLVNAVSEADIDPAKCRPILSGPDPRDPLAPDPRRDFLRLFRITGSPPGQQGKGLTYLASERGPEVRQHILLAFNRPAELGTMVFPMLPPGEIAVRFSTLKKGLTLPADLYNEELWQTVPLPKNLQGWSAVPFLPDTVTRALRITFIKGVDDEFADALAMPGDNPKQGAWSASIEGMKLLRRRYESLLPEASVMVNSGVINAAGEWDARRDTPLTPEEPAVYALHWKRSQPVRGLAIKEIDAKRVEIDVFTGGDGQAIDIKDDSLWRQVADYTPPLRDYYGQNSDARYIDGYVDFGPDVVTRAVRLRMVEQWTTRADGAAGMVGVRRDRGGMELSPSRCHVYGVAPLRHLGGAPEDPLGAHRLEVVNTTTGKIERELPLPDGGALAVGPGGTAYGLSGNRILRLDLKDGKHEAVVEGLQSPRALAVDAKGRFYVFEGAPELQVVRIYDGKGRLDGQFGTPGGFRAGPWDPTRFGNVTALSIDSRGQIWVAESQQFPKRTTLWNPDGTFRRELFGRTGYGGGGVGDPGNPNLLYYGPLEFEMDPKTGLTRLRSLTWTGPMPAGEQPIYVNGRKYMVTRQCFFRQSVGIVYLYDGGALKPVAAMGMAGGFSPLTAPRFRPLLGGKPLAHYQFVWSDLNGNGEVDPDEVRLMPATIVDVTNFDPFLGVTGGRQAYKQGDFLAFEVERFLPTGVPVYAVRELPFKGDNAYRLRNGNYFMLGEARGRAPDGTELWHYPTEGTGVHAYYKAGPFSPEQVVAEFSIIGHGIAPKGDLGEYLVTSSNPGAWHLWTADGLLAAYIFLDQRDPRARLWNMPEARRGMIVENVTAGQEHFWGSVTQADDGRTLGVYNSTHVFEIEGMDRFRRFSGTLDVTAQDVRTAFDAVRQDAAGEAYGAARLASLQRIEVPVRIDGDGGDWGGIEPMQLELPSPFSASLRIAHDGTQLYALYEVSGMGPFKNSGEDTRQLFKTGAAVDLMLGVDPAARADRRVPVAGDQRLLFAMLGGQPVAMLYEAVVPGLSGHTPERFATLVFATSFDRIRRLDNARIAVRGHANGYTLEAAVPLRELGLPPEPGALIKFDWGVMRADPEGHGLLGRYYWSNRATSILSDVALEASLDPYLWGHMRFPVAGEQRTGHPRQPVLGVEPAAGDPLIDDMLHELTEESR